MTQFHSIRFECIITDFRIKKNHVVWCVPWSPNYHTLIDVNIEEGEFFSGRNPWRESHRSIPLKFPHFATMSIFDCARISKVKRKSTDRTSFETESRRNCRGKLRAIQWREKEEMRFRSEIHIAWLKGKTKPTKLMIALKLSSKNTFYHVFER